HMLVAGLAGAVLCVSAALCHGQIRQRSAADLLAQATYAWKTDSTAHTRIHYLDNSPAADSLERLKRDIEVSWTKAADFVGAARRRRARPSSRGTNAECRRRGSG